MEKVNLRGLNFLINSKPAGASPVNAQLRATITNFPQCCQVNDIVSAEF
jgi:hypothetical protein